MQDNCPKKIVELLRIIRDNSTIRRKLVWNPGGIWRMQNSKLRYPLRGCVFWFWWDYGKCGRIQKLCFCCSDCEACETPSQSWKWKYVIQADSPKWNQHRCQCSRGAARPKQRRFLRQAEYCLKETGETLYWIRLFHATGYLTEVAFRSLYSDCTELEKLLVSIIRTLQQRNTP